MPASGESGEKGTHERGIDGQREWKGRRREGREDRVCLEFGRRSVKRVIDR